MTFETPAGTARGTSFDSGFGRERLTVRYGVSESVGEQLTEGSAGAVMEAQQAFADRLQALQAPDRASGSHEVYSATADGTIFSLVRGNGG
ncbi:hypothetical protein [Amycolatopsis sp. NPDC051128]|uniref:hypothetical protein n=1 Tax=Amycolatopsis sp. NPDC051128 TaxID=3155412 RepID=UPI003417FFE8